MKKDIEWLKEEVNKALRDMESDGISYYDYMVLKKSLNELINQLDEPETLSQEWISKFTSPVDDEGRLYIWKSDLQNVMVPKQELPVIPKFVAEWYESEGKRSSWWNWFYKWGGDEHRTDLETKAIGWMQDYNEEVFVNMFLRGYTVEKEQKYQVIIRDGEYMRLYLCKHDGNVTIGTNDNYIEKCPEVTYLTEQEIKDYDERYFAFAVKVEELEE